MCCCFSLKRQSILVNISLIVVLLTTIVTIMVAIFHVQNLTHYHYHHHHHDRELNLDGSKTQTTKQQPINCLDLFGIPLKVPNLSAKTASSSLVPRPHNNNGGGGHYRIHSISIYGYHGSCHHHHMFILFTSAADNGPRLPPPGHPGPQGPSFLNQLKVIQPELRPGEEQSDRPIRDIALLTEQFVRPFIELYRHDFPNDFGTQDNPGDNGPNGGGGGGATKTKALGPVVDNNANGNGGLKIKNINLIEGLDPSFVSFLYLTHNINSLAWYKYPKMHIVIYHHIGKRMLSVQFDEKRYRKFYQITRQTYPGLAPTEIVNFKVILMLIDKEESRTQFVITMIDAQTGRMFQRNRKVIAFGVSQNLEHCLLLKLSQGSGSGSAAAPAQPRTTKKSPPKRKDKDPKTAKPESDTGSGIVTGSVADFARYQYVPFSQIFDTDHLQPFKYRNFIYIGINATYFVYFDSSVLDLMFKNRPDSPDRQTTRLYRGTFDHMFQCDPEMVEQEESKSYWDLYLKFYILSGAIAVLLVGSIIGTICLKIALDCGGCSCCCCESDSGVSPSPSPSPKTKALVSTPTPSATSGGGTSALSINNDSKSDLPRPYDPVIDSKSKYPKHQDSAAAAAGGAAGGGSDVGGSVGTGPIPAIQTLTTASSSPSPTPVPSTPPPSRPKKSNLRLKSAVKIPSSPGYQETKSRLKMNAFMNGSPLPPTKSKFIQQPNQVASQTPPVAAAPAPAVHSRTRLATASPLNVVNGNNKSKFGGGGQRIASLGAVATMAPSGPKPKSAGLIAATYPSPTIPQQQQQQQQHHHHHHRGSGQQHWQQYQQQQQQQQDGEPQILKSSINLTNQSPVKSAIPGGPGFYATTSQIKSSQSIDTDWGLAPKIPYKSVPQWPPPPPKQLLLQQQQQQQQQQLRRQQLAMMKKSPPNSVSNFQRMHEGAINVEDWGIPTTAATATPATTTPNNKQQYQCIDDYLDNNNINRKQ